MAMLGGSGLEVARGIYRPLVEWPETRSLCRASSSAAIDVPCRP